MDPMGIAIGAVFVIIAVFCGIGMLLNERREAKRRELEAALSRPKQDKSNLGREIGQGLANGVAAQGGVRSDLAMAKVKCVSCGAAIEPGQKFCSHCGTQIPDDTFRAEIKVEDRADLIRAAYEEKESQLRQKAMKQEMHENSGAKVVVIILAVLGAGLIAAAFILQAVEPDTTGPTRFRLVLFGVPILFIAGYLAYRLLFKKK